MRDTLFHIPPEFLGIPVFGPFSWAILLWAIVSIGLLALLIRQNGFNAETKSYLPLLGILGSALAFLFPILEETIEMENHGIPIRSYGMMMLVGVVCGVGLAADRARRMRLDPEIVLSLAFWMFCLGILGARLFFVIQKREQFFADPVSALRVWEGGLVVYGSLVGALLGACIFYYKNKLPALAITDLIAPCMVLGLAFGRIGCLLNGCCFGGACEQPWAISFPANSPPNAPSPPYSHQLHAGWLHGVRCNLENVVTHVYPGSIADENEVKVGDRVISSDGRTLRVEKKSGEELDIPLTTFPAWSRPIHPTQIYSAINATVLFLFLMAYYPYRRRDGEVIAITFALYAITRFLLEMIRNDEAGIFGTWFTISQWVSIGMLGITIALVIVISRKPPGSVFPVQSPAR